MKWTGYSELNKPLNILEELIQTTYSRMNNLQCDELTQARAESTKEAYKFCQYLLTNIDKFND